MNRTWLLAIGLAWSATFARAAAATLTASAPPAIEQEASPAPLQNGQPPKLQDFEQALSDYGHWIQTTEYGPVWSPNDVGAGWRPYTNGQWLCTDYGWTFVASEPWGWAPFHYGRWVYDAPYGWVWIPGYEWAPAWVAWRYGGGYVAWAPLGPESVRLDYYDFPSLWIAVGTGFFCEPLLHSHFVPTARIEVVFHATHFTGLPRHGHFFAPPMRYVAHARGRAIVRIPADHVAPRWVSGGTVHRAGAPFEPGPRVSRAEHPTPGRVGEEPRHAYRAGGRS